MIGTVPANPAVDGATGDVTSDATGDAAGDPVARALVVGALGSALFLQKLAIPGTGGGLPLNLPVVLGFVGLGLAFGRLVVLPAVLLALAPVAGVLILVSGLSGAPTFSLNALALVLALLVPYALAFRPGLVGGAFAGRVLVRFALVFAVMGIVQFLAQFVVGAERAFWLDMNLPPDLLLAGFNNLNELSFESGIYKANGVFLLEASFLNQLLCLAILIELVTSRRASRLALLAAGVLVTYSGTGVMMLAVVAPFYLVRHRHYGLALGGALLVAAVALFGESLGFGALLDRAGEFGSDQSSAFARFLSIFYLLGQFVWSDPVAILVGRGPGTVHEYFDFVTYSAFDPSWGKLAYEYGLAGLAAYATFLIGLVARARGSGELKTALLFQFFFLGGYVATTPVHIEIWLLLTWPTAVPMGLPRAPWPAGALASVGSRSRPLPGGAAARALT